MGSESEEPQHKVDRRKKRTSSNQYMMYIEMMEDDPIFASGRLTRDVDINYLPKKWKELAAKLNTCTTGPKLTAEEWRKRLNDWKNTTRCKYRRSVSGEKDITLTSLEVKALNLFGKTAPTNTVAVDQLSIQLKEEKNEMEDNDHDSQRGDTLKQLQAAVDEAIRCDENEEEEGDDMMQEEHEEHELLTVPISTGRSTHVDDGGGGGGSMTVNKGNGANLGNQSNSTTYRTILVENSGHYDDDNGDEFITHRRPSMVVNPTAGTVGQTVVSTPSQATTVTKLINGDIPLKRLRSQAPEQIIYEVKKAPVTQRTITVHSTPATTTQYHQSIHNQQPQQLRTIEVSNSYVPTTPAPIAAGTVGMTSQDAREIARQLKRLADIKAEKLKFDVARFKFNNPGFHFNLHL